MSERKVLTNAIDACLKPKPVSSGRLDEAVKQEESSEVGQDVSLTDTEPLHGATTTMSTQAIAKNERTVLANAFDVLGDRTKRRKISQEPETAPILEDQKATKPRSKRPVKRKQEDQPGNVGVQQDATPKTRKSKAPKAVEAQLQSRTETMTDEASGAPQAVQTSNPADAEGLITNQSQISPTPNKSDNVQVKSIRKSPRKQQQTKILLKNGKLTQELKVIMRYHNKAVTGPRIDAIQSSPRKSMVQDAIPPQVNGSGATKNAAAQAKSTHPFFTGKPKQFQQAASADNTVKPVAWSDLVFKKKQLPTHTREEERLKAPWPSASMQHIHPQQIVRGFNTQVASGERKQKSKTAIVPPDEDILLDFSSGIRIQQPEGQVRKPTKLYQQLRPILEDLDVQFQHISHPSIRRVRRRVLEETGWFDRGSVPGPLPWTQKYAPTSWEEVLQPECYKLYEWLQSLAVHQVKQGLSVISSKHKKKKPKKKAPELDDFIVSDEEPERQKVKNAILIVGPHGCGKTAAVYAVAQQSQFEIFEMHPGMRRSQRDIAEKVGDMTQNHMVQQGAGPSREASLPAESDIVSSQESSKQAPLANFFGVKSTSKSKSSTPIPAQRKPKEQKQSVVLFEEVDQVFEDDRGFWSGVQSLISSSKRPVILTCNRLDDVPRQDLDLHDVLDFTTVAGEVAEAFMSYVALSEGHVVDRSAIRSLYDRKNQDLRAAMTELDFWCQMAIGSEKAGLDWFPEKLQSAEYNSSSCRTLSKGSYHHSLDEFATGSTESWYRYTDPTPDSDVEESCSKLNRQLDQFTLEECVDACESYSAAELIEKSLQSEVLSMIHATKQDTSEAPTLQQIPPSFNMRHMFDCLRPLEIERPVFPPAHGRLAPSLDAGTSILATDIAPYVRTIAAFDQRLEHIRDQLFSSQGKKTRNTRAARAAAEGGDKASTRRERWFHSSLDLGAVLRTGGDWQRDVVNEEDVASTPRSTDQILDGEASNPVSVVSMEHDMPMSS